jgi:hypothetical protein
VHFDPPPAGPSATGATLVLRARDQPGNAATWDVPAGTRWVTDSPAGARYVNAAAPTGGGIRVTRLRPGRALRIVARSLGDTSILDIAAGNPGILDVVLSIGPHRLCAAFAPGEWSPRPGGGARLVARTPASTSPCDAPTTTTTTRPADCRAVSQPPGSCAADADCPAGYACAGGQCAAGACVVRTDCALEGECVYDDTAGVCVCRGCGPQACPLGCRQGFLVSGCRCDHESDCPPEDDVCFMGLCN